MIRRLQRMDVRSTGCARSVGARLQALRPRPPVPGLPAGTWYVPMAQMQKHWVQAMLNEDTYTPFPYFYDVTAWSQPLLFNVRGGYSGGALRVNAAQRGELDEPGADHRPGTARGSLWQTVRGLHVRDRVRGLAALAAREAGVRRTRR